MNVPVSQGSPPLPAIFLVPNPRIQSGLASITFESISIVINELMELSARHSPFSFQAAVTSVAPSIFFKVKKLALPRLQLHRKIPSSRLEAELYSPLEEANVAPNCLILPASSCPSKPYVKVDADMLEEVSHVKRWS
jgi:hypothetical protein